MERGGSTPKAVSKISKARKYVSTETGPLKREARRAFRREWKADLRAGEFDTCPRVRLSAWDLY